MYSEKVLKHFKDPKNVGEMKDADGMGTVGNPVCGDMMSMYIKVRCGYSHQQHDHRTGQGDDPGRGHGSI
jgi:hypothetical protein